MDVFAYVTLGLCGGIALVVGGFWLSFLLRDSMGRFILLVLGMWLLAISGIVSAVWLIGTKLI